ISLLGAVTSCACAEPRRSPSATPASDPPPITATASASVALTASSAAPSSALPRETLRHASERVAADFEGRQPVSWGQDIAGVLTHFEADAEHPKVALTLDACGGPGGDGYDATLIEFLRAEKVPATLFLTARWIEANPKKARALAADPLFLIENHGARHRP